MEDYEGNHRKRSVSDLVNAFGGTKLKSSHASTPKTAKEDVPTEVFYLFVDDWVFDQFGLIDFSGE